MRIDKIQLQNFKKYAEQTFDFHKQFTLLVGENGSGKTTVLDALAVAAGIWLKDPPDSLLNNSRRNILSSEIRLGAEKKGDRIQLREFSPVVVSATGRIGKHENVSWTRQIKQGGRQTSNTGAKDALELVKEIYARDLAGDNVLCPILAYYGAGRAWLPSNERAPKPKVSGPARRWAAFYDCFNERIRFAELHRWFNRETTERGNRGGRWRPGFEAVRIAVMNCVQNSDDVWFDTDRNQIVLSISGNAQPFDNLSAGQRMMLSLVADIAIKAVTQNAFLLPPDQFDTIDNQLPKVLSETPGLVLIDELDVHLHPSWQRRVATDLKRTFPSIQFVCTSHSPQVIGEVSRDEVRLLEPNGIKLPSVAYGADSNWLLNHVMEGASSETPEALRLQNDVEDALEEGNLVTARTKLEELRGLLDGVTGEFARLEGSLSSLELLAREDGNSRGSSENN